MSANGPGVNELGAAERGPDAPGATGLGTTGLGAGGTGAGGAGANGVGATGRGRHGERVAYWDLAADTGSAATARALTGQALRDWRVSDQRDVDDIVLMVDELVTNAVVHGRGRVRLRLRLRDARFTAEVGDDNPVAPAPPSGPEPDVLRWAEDGRGLLLVGAMASSFGTRPESEGKTVWFSRALHAVNGNRPAPGLPPADAEPITSP